MARDRDARVMGFDHGIMIESVIPGSAAAKAGLVGLHVDESGGRYVAGDGILAINGEPVNTVADYGRVMAKLRVQQTVTVTIRRGDQTRDVKVTLEGI
jgi:S1-C subfamily serine protease